VVCAIAELTGKPPIAPNAISAKRNPEGTASMNLRQLFFNLRLLAQVPIHQQIASTVNSKHNDFPFVQ
jgi:hypothetical protein